MTWLDVLIVGMLAGPAAAGVYGAATRFTSAGMIVSTSLRIVVAPMYSRHLGAGRLDGVQHLYSITTRWIVLFSVPVYVVMALYGGTILGILGPDFRQGAATLAVLAAGMGLVLVAGNIQSVLLMSGHSVLVAVNKTVAVVFNVALLLLLVPGYGLIGAAVSWTLAMLVDTLLALWQVRRRIGVRAVDHGIRWAVVVTLLATASPAALCRAFLGDSYEALTLSASLGAALLTLMVWRLRVTFRISDLAAMVRPRSGR